MLSSLVWGTSLWGCSKAGPVGSPDVDEVEDVLLEAGAAKAHAGVQELGADARVRACQQHCKRQHLQITSTLQ